jgi:Topoisomerase 6 subunit A/Spo11, Toprim domain
MGLEQEQKGDIKFDMLVNRTPITGEISAYRNSEKKISVTGCGLGHYFDGTPTKGGYEVAVNITTPYCPITSDGKAPNLRPFIGAIADAVTAASKKAQRAAPKEKKLSQKAVVLAHLDAVIAEVSDDGEYRFNQRQLLYRLRPVVMNEIGEELKEGNYNGIITDYENEHGEIAGMYREPRGSIYHPHRKQTITLGTLMVEDYKRPIWTFNKIVYIEKEGFSEALKDKGWAERHDCMLMSSKGFTTRAARDLVDKLAAHDEPVDVFCVHDADGPGTMIYQTFQEATRARGARKIKIIDLGLQPWEAIALRLEVENVERGEKRKPVAEYVLERADGNRWDEWLQTHRVELNAMTTPQFIAWLDRKMAEHGEGKLIPPPEVLASELEAKLEASVRAVITERILREADLEGQIRDALEAIERPSAAALEKGIARLFKRSPKREWRDHITAVVNEKTC